GFCAGTETDRTIQVQLTLTQTKAVRRQRGENICRPPIVPNTYSQCILNFLEGLQIERARNSIPSELRDTAATSKIDIAAVLRTRLRGSHVHRVGPPDFRRGAR